MTCLLIIGFCLQNYTIIMKKKNKMKKIVRFLLVFIIFVVVGRLLPANQKKLAHVCESVSEFIGVNFTKSSALSYLSRNFLPFWMTMPL